MRDVTHFVCVCWYFKVTFNFVWVLCSRPYMLAQTMGRETPHHRSRVIHTSLYFWHHSQGKVPREPVKSYLPHTIQSISYLNLYIKAKFGYIYKKGFQKLCEGTKGLRRKVWTWTEILRTNIRYIVAILTFVTIYTLFGNLWAKKCFLHIILN